VFRTLTITALAGASMLALASVSPASAFTLAYPSLSQPIASAQIDKVWWRGGGWRGGWGGGWHGGWRGAGWRGGWGWRRGWGWGPAAVAGGVVAGAALVGPGYYGGYYGPGPGYYGPGPGWGWGPVQCGRAACDQ
jgi:hypothetical protein